VLFGVDPGLGRDLPAGARGSVQPEDRATPWRTELGEPDSAVVRDRHVSLELRASDREDHAQQLFMWRAVYKTLVFRSTKDLSADATKSGSSHIGK